MTWSRPKKPLLPANLRTYDIPGDSDKLGIEAMVDSRAYELYKSAVRLAGEDVGMVRRILQAAETLALIGATADELADHLGESASQAAQAYLLTRAEVTPQEFAEDPQASADKLATLVLKGLSAAGKEPPEGPGSSGAN